MAPAVLWFRRDLRLADHPGLEAAVAAGGEDGVVPLFVLDPALWGPSGDPRRAFLVGCLEALDEDLSGTLLVRHGDPAAEVPAVARHHGSPAVFVSADFGPYGRWRDEAVGTALRGHGRRLVAMGSPYAVEPGTILRGQAVQGLHALLLGVEGPRLGAPTDRPKAPFVRDLKGHGVPAAPRTTAALLAAGEPAALALLEEFLDTHVDA